MINRIDPVKNIFETFPGILNEEFIEELLFTKEFKLERIISEGHSSPDDFWYDQQKNEFVLLLAGSATISYDSGEKFELKPGDYLIINAHQKHRVDWTDQKQKTFWLTIHY
jgi:cupin 2 domain-containing protein